MLTLIPAIEIGGHWLSIRDGNPQAAALYRRHYSARQYVDGRRDVYGYRNRNLICGPGEKLLLLTGDGSALFVWRKFQDESGQEGINCAVFRNEGEVRSSELIVEAEAIAWRRWPGERLYTYVNPTTVKSANPGYCFKCAGWKRCGVTKVNKLLIFEKQPMPLALAVDELAWEVPL